MIGVFANFEPAEEEPEACDGEGDAKPRIEACEEFGRHARQVFQPYAEPHHEGYEQVASQVEKGEQRLAFLGKIEDAKGVAFDKVVEHQRESHRYSQSHHRQPPDALGVRRCHAA